MQHFFIFTRRFQPNLYLFSNNLWMNLFTVWRRPPESRPGSTLNMRSNERIPQRVPNRMSPAPVTTFDIQIRIPTAGGLGHTSAEPTTAPKVAILATYIAAAEQIFYGRNR